MTESVKPVIVDGPSKAELFERLELLVGDISGEGAKSKKRRLILDHATRLFVEQGYRKTSMGEVAKAAGMAKGTVYLYYANKSALMMACICREKLQTFTAFAKLFDEAVPARERLRWFVETALLMVQQMPLTHRLVQGDEEMAAVIADMPPELMLQSENDGRVMFAGLLRESIAPARLPEHDIMRRVQVLRSLPYMASHVPYEHVRGELSQRDYASALADTLVTGLIESARRYAASMEDAANKLPAEPSTEETGT